MYKTRPKTNAFCKHCQILFVKNISWQIYCSYECGYTARNNEVRQTQKNAGNCLRCDKSLANKRLNAIYCSKTCKSMDHSFKHRSNTRTANIARRMEIIERDGYVCYLCNGFVDLKDVNLDHLIPVSLGGTNDSFNLAVTHSKCNKARGVRIDTRQIDKLNSLKAQIDY